MKDEPTPPTAIDRELQAALDVAPSADFLARVRRRLGEEPPASRAGLVWWGAPAGAIAAVLTIAAYVIMRSPAESPPAPKLAQASTTATSPGMTTPASPFVPAPAPASKASPPRPFRRSAGTRVAEVLVPSEQAALIRQLFEGLRTERIDAGSLLSEPASNAQADRPVSLEPIGVPGVIIAPLGIEPLTIDPKGQE